MLHISVATTLRVMARGIYYNEEGSYPVLTHMTDKQYLVVLVDNKSIYNSIRIKYLGEI